MSGEDLASEIPLVVVIGCIAVAVMVANLGLGLTNVMSAGSTEPSSTFGIARDALAPGSLPGASQQTTAGRFLDVNSLREKFTALDDRSFALRREVAALSRELQAQRRAAALMDNPQTEPVSGGLRPLLAEAARNWRERSHAWEVSKTLSLSGGGEEPQWIECVASGVILHPQKTRFEAGAIHSPAQAFLAALRPGQLMLLIRPSGYAVCGAVLNLLSSRGMNAVLEPVDEDWRLSVDRRSP